MPSVYSRVDSVLLPSSTVMTPSLPTFSMASAMSWPMCSSPLALIGATRLKSSWPLTFVGLVLSAPAARFAAAGPEGRLDGPRELRQPGADLGAGVDVESHLLGCHGGLSFVSCPLSVVKPPCAVSRAVKTDNGLLEHAQEVGLAEDHVLRP